MCRFGLIRRLVPFKLGPSKVIGQHSVIHSLPRQQVCFPLAPPESTLTFSPKQKVKTSSTCHQRSTLDTTLRISHAKRWKFCKTSNKSILFPKRGIIQKHQYYAPNRHLPMCHESHLVSVDHPVMPSSLPNADAEKTQDKEKVNPEISTPVPQQTSQALL